MRTIQTTAVVSKDGTLTIHAPPDVPPGTHRVVVVIEDAPVARDTEPPKLHVWNWDAFPPDTTFRREDMYDDNGRLR